MPPAPRDINPLRLPQGVSFRPLVEADVVDALRIIRAHDSDDGDVARAAYAHSLDHQYVMARSGRVMGVTGGNPVDGTYGSWWLSWTYLDGAERGRGLGGAMLQRMLHVFARKGARKVFLTTSDLRTRTGTLKYGPAMRAYLRAGFDFEAHHPDFYEVGEGMVVMGRRVRARVRLPLPVDERSFALSAAERVVETDDAWYLDWRYAEAGQGSTVTEIEAAVGALEDARVAFVGIPSDLPLAETRLRDAGFYCDGRLTDFHEDGVDELRLRRDL